jgi:hypothetical protein
VQHPAEGLLLGLSERGGAAALELRLDELAEIGGDPGSAEPAKNEETPHVHGFFDAGGGTRTPDTRIMIGALPLM